MPAPARFAPLEAALACGRLGLATFPLKPESKAPDGDLVPNGHLQATTDSGTHRRWWGARPDNGVGVSAVASGLIVVDSDPRHAGDESLAQLEAVHGALPATVEVVTGGGGRHLYYRRPVDIEPTNLTGANALWPGVDLIMAGYVVVPPSIHPDTKMRYEWVIGSEPGRFPIADPPAWLVGAIRARASAKAAAPPIPDVIPLGERDQTLTSLAGSMRRRGASEDSILAALEIENGRCEEPLPDRALQKIARSVAKYTPSTPTNNAPKSSFPVPPGTRNDNPSALRLMPLPDLLSEPPEEVEWQWEGLLIAGGTGLLAGKPKAGKSTAARALAYRTATGGALLGRQCRKGRVLHVGIEEKRSRLADAYRQMGAPTSDLIIHTGPPPERPIEALYNAIVETRAVLVVVDPLFKFTPVADSNDYSVVSAALAPIEAIARQTGACILMVHHLGKTDRDDGDNILGSTAIFGSVDTALILRRKDNQRQLSSIQRFGTDLEPTVIELDEHGTPHEAGSVEGYEIRKAADAILTYLEASPEAEEKDIRSAVSGKTTHTSTALRLLIEEKKVDRTGAGKKGNPYRYSASGLSFLVPPTGAERGTRKSPDTSTNGTHDGTDEAAERSATADVATDASRHTREVFTP